MVYKFKYHTWTGEFFTFIIDKVDVESYLDKTDTSAKKIYDENGWVFLRYNQFSYGRDFFINSDDRTHENFVNSMKTESLFLPDDLLPLANFYLSFHRNRKLESILGN